MTTHRILILAVAALPFLTCDAAAQDMARYRNWTATIMTASSLVLNGAGPCRSSAAWTGTGTAFSPATRSGTGNRMTRGRR